jgi:hypothetical protein
MHLRLHQLKAMNLRDRKQRAAFVRLPNNRNSGSSIGGILQISNSVKVQPFYLISDCREY